MVDVAEPIGEELSTLSTAPTVRTTVQTDEESRDSFLDPRRAREEKQGGCGGKEGKPPEPPGALDPGWARALSSRTSCTLGRCAYADPTKRPSRYLAAIGCDGYHASRSTDTDGRVTVRWGLCPRHREWWRLERLRVAGAKARPSPHPGLGPER
jgi:hypothetical protein